MTTAYVGWHICTAHGPASRQLHAAMRMPCGMACHCRTQLHSAKLLLMISFFKACSENQL
jgi:hypothetical protein